MKRQDPNDQTHLHHSGFVIDSSLIRHSEFWFRHLHVFIGTKKPAHTTRHARAGESSAHQLLPIISSMESPLRQTR
ncbi:MAG: hypothetical protein Q8M07_12785, partial [Prosthecobacter sp.]|nr:hypothetical protein [Prosthecobacter sp.]